MREVLFRGKRLDTGGWVYGYYCKHIKRQVCPVGDELKPEDIAHLIINDGFADWNMPRSLQAYDVDPETVGQYTGMTDETKSKIFEGDLYRSDSGYIFEVVYLESEACFVGVPVKEPESWVFLEDVLDMRKVGNKWDNPELLEVQDGN